jgi:hypothetical protein
VEIELDKNIYSAIVVGVIVVVVLGFFWVLVPLVGDIFHTKPAPKLDDKTQLQYLNWSICQDQDAMQMYIQTPSSSHPKVKALKSDIELYNRMAMDLEVSNFSNCR